MRYYGAGKQKRMSLGCYPQISLKEARTRRDDARALVAQGINPYEHRKQQRLAVHAAKEHAFEAVFNQWVEFRRLSLKEGRQSTLSQILRIFSKDVLPILGGRSIYDINRHDLLDLLSKRVTSNTLHSQSTGSWALNWSISANARDLPTSRAR